MEHPRVGQTFIIGRLRAQGYRVTRERVRQATRTCDPLNVALRWQGMDIRRCIGIVVSVKNLLAVVLWFLYFVIV